jgi:hypothetical protein
MSYIQRKDRQAEAFLNEARNSPLPIYEVEENLKRNLSLNLPLSGNEAIIHKEIRIKIMNLWDIYKKEQIYNPKVINLNLYSGKEISRILGETIAKREDRRAKSKYKK